MRFLPLFLAIACAPGLVAVQGLDESASTGWVGSPIEEATGPTSTGGTDLSAWEGATLEVTTPAAGDFLTWGQTHAFAAEIHASDGTVLEWADIEWSSDSAPDWFETGAAFDTDALPIGSHAFTATATLPTGAVVQHTVGSVMVQHAHGGTYVGILDVDGTILNIPVSCTGASVLVVDRYGDEATGDGDCVVSVLGLGEIPLHYVFELDIDGTGAVSGTAAADLLGWFQYNFPASGTLVPDGAGFDLVFEGSVPLMGPLNGATDAVRVSLDSE